MTGFGWASNPLLPRLGALNIKSKTNSWFIQINHKPPFFLGSLKVLYGSNTWMTQLQQNDFTENGVKCAVDVEYIQNAGHHIYADQSKPFNEAVNKHLEEEKNK